MRHHIPSIGRMSINKVSKTLVNLWFCLTWKRESNILLYNHLPQSGKAMAMYDIEIVVEEIDDGGDYRFVATSPDLPNLLVGGDTPEEVIDLAPQVASALIASMNASGDPLPPTVRPMPKLPFSSRIAVTA